ncbi:hypothetical protein [Streptomyces zingiberis]|uniref:hypothetical protein n=1 Tax=Streptomyces zingiberis TaxID=2053010 RepID=UPI001F0EC8F9|nr:hypothetical protein [Streptomyces zingiberis]
MVFLHALTTTVRMVRHTAGLATGLVPDDEVVLDAPDERLSGVLAAAGAGDHLPAAALLAVTREHAQWEYRDRCAAALARFAHHRPEWLARWRAAAPGDPDVALLRAAVALRRAERRTEQREWLAAATPLIRAAAEAAPHDPVPWRLALDQARGLRLPQAEFAALWSQAVARSPHHSGCHAAALRYLTSRCRTAPAPRAERRPAGPQVPLTPATAGDGRRAGTESGHGGAARAGRRAQSGDEGHGGGPGGSRGSHGGGREEGDVLVGTHLHDPCFSFAERAAQAALPGSLLQALPVRAILDHVHPGPLDLGGPGAEPGRARAGAGRRPRRGGHGGPGPEGGEAVGIASARRLDAAVDLAVGLSARYAPGDPWPAEVRNVLVLVLMIRGRWEEALHQFRLIGPHATAFPWTTVSDDPLGQFLEARDGTRLQVAASMPLWRRGPHAAPAGR